MTTVKERSKNYCNLFCWGYRACTFILDNVILYEKEISVLIVIADPEIFIRIIRSYLCTINSIAGIAT